jgi:hypothetical protein
MHRVTQPHPLDTGLGGRIEESRTLPDSSSAACQHQFSLIRRGPDDAPSDVVEYCDRCGEIREPNVDREADCPEFFTESSVARHATTPAARGTAAVSSPAGLGASGHDRSTEGVPAGRPSSGWVRPRHVGPGDLIGAVITYAYVKHSTVRLSLRGREGRRFHVAVMSDPEGNGPGSLHVSDTQLMTFLGTLGGD